MMIGRVVLTNTYNLIYEVNFIENDKLMIET